MDSFSPAEEDVSRIRYEASKFGRRVRSADPSGLKKLWRSTTLLFWAKSLSRLTNALKRHPYKLPTEREQLVECLEQIGAVSQKLVSIVELSEQRGISEKLVFGEKTLKYLKRSALSIREAEEGWQLELNNCFPELFSELDNVIDLIQPRVLPNMSPETLTLASKALETSNARKDADIDEWARKLALDVLENND